MRKVALVLLRANKGMEVLSNSTAEALPSTVASNSNNTAHLLSNNTDSREGSREAMGDHHLDHHRVKAKADTSREDREDMVRHLHHRGTEWDGALTSKRHKSFMNLYLAGRQLKVKLAEVFVVVACLKLGVSIVSTSCNVK